ncbi:MAG: amidohydrolase family protein [Christensenellales bacterium]
MLDLIIRGGRIFDPANGIDAVGDIGVRDGLISAATDEAAQVIDADGCMVVPGLIDAHCHLWPLMPMGIQPESACFSSGVTAAVDGGSAGWLNYETYRAAVAAMGVNVRVLINLGAGGLSTLGSYGEIIDPDTWDVPKITKMVRQYPEVIGLKLRMGRETLRGLGMKPLEAAVRIAREAGTRLMVHPTNSDVPMRDILDALGVGDILTHAFYGHGETLLGSGAMEAARRAQARGVWLDIGDACWHFSGEVYREAIGAGVYADTVSTDMTCRGLYKKPSGAFSMPYCMSRQLCYGLTVERVLTMATIAPARMMGIADAAGSLSIGRTADIAVLRVEERRMEFTDGTGETVVGNSCFRPMLTVRAGQIVFRDIAI